MKQPHYLRDVERMSGFLQNGKNWINNRAMPAAERRVLHHARFRAAFFYLARVLSSTQGEQSLKKTLLFLRRREESV